MDLLLSKYFNLNCHQVDIEATMVNQTVLVSETRVHDLRLNSDLLSPGWPASTSEALRLKVPLHLLRIEPRALYMLGEHSTC